VKVNKKEFKDNKIKYNRKGKLRKRHKSIEIDKSFRESGTVRDNNYIYYCDNYEESKKIFAFFADNTIVEWAHVIYKNFSNDKTKNEIITSHTANEVDFYFPSDGKRGDYILVDVRHSHPVGFVSDFDRKMNEHVNENAKVTYIYKTGKYYKFTKDRSKNDIFPIEREPKSY
jgi:hypothetical protein